MKDETSIVFYDLETGGFDENKNPILEIAFVFLIRDLNTGQFEIDEIDTKKRKYDYSFETLVNPYYNESYVIEEKALSVNKLDLKMLVKEGADSKFIIEEIIKRVEQINPKNKDKTKPILAGHNIDKFDMKFLKRFFEEHNKNLFDYFNLGTIDTYTMAKGFLGGNKMIQSLSLGNLCSYFNVPLKNSHTAYDDALANAKLYLKWSSAFNSLKRSQFI